MKLTINKLSFSYAGNPVLKDVDFSVNAGEVLSIVGPNGSGKSTLLKCINRLLKPSKNAVFIEDCDISKISLKDLSKLMGYVPQSTFSTFPYTVFDVVLMGRRPYVQWNLSDDDTEIVADILDFLGLSDFAMRHFNELSGGEQQKVIVARALAQQPQILLLDEPTSSLDIRHQLEILCILRSLTEDKDRSIIMSIHDLNLASRFSDKMLLLRKGEIYAAGSPNDVLTASNIEAIYGVKCTVSTSSLGTPQVTPLLSGFDRVRHLRNSSPVTVSVSQGRIKI
jgi:iron complex transport system ATP-binding protein